MATATVTTADNATLILRDPDSSGRVRRALRPYVGYLCLAPAMLLLVLFYYVPAILLFVISVFHYQLLGGHSSFVGVHNFVALFHQALFVKSLEVSGYFVGVMVPATIAVALALALLVRDAARAGKRWRRGGVSQALIFLPHVTPIVATTIIWLYMFNPRYGLINDIVTLFVAHPPGWLDSSTWALPAIMIYSLWHSVGLYVVLFLAGLATVPDRLVDAARVEGVRGFAMFRKVIWPLITPTVFLVGVLATVSSLQTFSQIYTLSGGARGGGGGPAYSTTTDALLIYETAFRYFHYSLAAAMSVILFFIIVAVTLFQRWASTKWVFYR